MPDPRGAMLPGSGRRMGVRGRSKRAMKRILMMCAMVLMALALCLPFLCAEAEQTTGIINYTMELSNNRFTGPEDITVTIKVTNVSDKDMPGPVTLYYPDGTMVLEFGSPTLASGQSQSWTGTWGVTMSQLQMGKITFGLCWYEYNDAGELGERRVNFSKTLIYVETEPSVEVNRIIAPSMAGNGQEVSVTYEIVNTGTVNITNVTIRENSDISKTSGTIESVPAGERASYTFTVKMGKKDLTSNGTITYRAGNSTGTVRKEDAVIKYGEIKLSASLKASRKGGVAGDTIKLTLTLKNTGSADYQNVTVTDALLGEIVTGTSVPANKTVTLEKEVTVTGSADYQFIVLGQDASGATVETATERVSIVEIDPEKAINLTVVATSDRDTIYELPGVVRFKVQVTNNGMNELENVSVSASGVTLYTFPKLASGETREFTRDVSITTTGQFRFDASVRNEIDETETFESNIVPIQFAQPTAEPTEAPITTVAPPRYEQMPTSDGLPEYVSTVEKILSVLNHAFLILAGVCGVLLIVGIVRRIQANSRAKDHLERSSARVYDQPAPKEKHSRKEDAKDEQQTVTRPIGEDNEPEVPEVQPGDDAVTRDGALMEETLRQLYKRADREDGEETIRPTFLPDEEPTVEIEDDAQDEATVQIFPEDEATVQNDPETDDAGQTIRRRRNIHLDDEQ